MTVIFEPDPDWDDSTEVRYEEHRARLSSGLCEICRENEAVPDDSICRDCIDEFFPEGAE